MGTLLVSGIVVIWIVLAIRSMIKDKKNGKSIQCGHDCKNCSGSCH